jgi:AcrR family transcriptional regulator
VARPLDPDSHALRREAYLDVTQGLIQTRGYEQFSIQDVLDAVGASKGAFYHYYDSKDALLDAVVDRMADQATERLEPVLSDPALTAVEKLEALFGGLAQFKSERKDFVLAILKVWLSDDNAIVRDKMRRLVSARLVPWLDRIVEQGIAEGAFSSRYPDFLARVLASLIQAMNELASELWLGRQLGTVRFEEVKRTFDAYLEAFERIVGVRPGSLKFLDEPTLQLWFG